MRSPGRRIDSASRAAIGAVSQPIRPKPRAASFSPSPKRACVAKIERSSSALSKVRVLKLCDVLRLLSPGFAMTGKRFAFRESHQSASRLAPHCGLSKWQHRGPSGRGAA